MVQRLLAAFAALQHRGCQQSKLGAALQRALHSDLQGEPPRASAAPPPKPEDQGLRQECDLWVEPPGGHHEVQGAHAQGQQRAYRPEGELGEPEGVDVLGEPADQELIGGEAADEGNQFFREEPDERVGAPPGHTAEGLGWPSRSPAGEVRMLAPPPDREVSWVQPLRGAAGDCLRQLSQAALSVRQPEAIVQSAFDFDQGGPVIEGDT